MEKGVERQGGYNDPLTGAPKTYQQDGDALTVKSASDVIIDHCSFSWADDGVVDLTQHRTGDNEQPEMDLTMQWSMIYQGLTPHSKASLVSGKFGSQFSVHHNLYGHCDQRMPKINYPPQALGVDSKGHFVNFANNVI